MKVNKLSGIFIRAAAVLICLVLFSAHLASGMFAKYAVGASGGSNARVARFDVSIEKTADLTFDDSGNGTYKFCVINKNSEVPFLYDIVVRISGTDPSGFFDASEIAGACSDVKLNGEAGTYSESSHCYTFPVSAYLDPGTDSDEYTFSFKKNDLVKINADAAEDVTTTDISIKLDVSAKGTQAN